ncbi:hypothetical protein [Lonepinella sp. BR2474]|uniref:hypothetical protein n=1 Tax=Lonepinella sp. BR2474 TaxID=3434548 RepID=UPI003F6DB3BF
MKDNFNACQWAWDNMEPDNYEDRIYFTMDEDYDEPDYDYDGDCDYWASNCYDRG